MPGPPKGYIIDEPNKQSGPPAGYVVDSDTSQSAPTQSYWDYIKSISNPQSALDFVKGVGKSALGTAEGLGDLITPKGSFWDTGHPDINTTPTNTAQKVGHILGDVGGGVALTALAPEVEGAGALPLLGRVATGAVAQGTINKAQGGDFATGAVLGGLAPLAAPVLKSVGKGLQILSSTPASRDLALTRFLVPGEAGEVATRAFKPSTAHPEFESNFVDALPAIAAQNPLPGVGGISDAVWAAKAANHTGYQSLLEPHSHIPVDLRDVGIAARESLPPLDALDPDVVAAARQQAVKFGVTKPLGNVDDLRVNANQKLNNFFAMNPGAQNGAEGNPETSRLLATRNALADKTYSTLSDLTGVPQEEIEAGQRQYGKLADVADVIGPRETVVKRQNPISLQEALTLAPHHPVASAIGFVGQKMLKQATDSDALANSIIDRYRNPMGTPLLPHLRLPFEAGKAIQQPGLTRYGLPALLPFLRDDQ